MLQHRLPRNPDGYESGDAVHDRFDVLSRKGSFILSPGDFG
jgi:hypothetical protein